MAHDPLEMLTLDVGLSMTDAPPETVPLLTILGHPDSRRVGDIAWLPALSRPSQHVEVSRVAPLFSPPNGGDNSPLSCPFVSRKALRLSRVGDRLNLDPGQLAGRVRVDGQSLDAAASVSIDALDDGVVVRLGSHVVLLLHRELPISDPLPDLGLVGESAGTRRLRRDILRLSDALGAVLIRGETGTGKELVAAALHSVSSRSGQPFVPVNMAAVPISIAASALFGHVRGAFSGAREAKDGYFGAACGGTLFMDEIGETPDELQAALLRVLETGEIQPVGASKPRHVDVRLVAATDADLEAAMKAKTFRGPLYYRLATHEIRVPSLAQRRADIGRLLIHFLRVDLGRVGRLQLLTPAPTQQRIWLSASVVERMALHAWPGNIRELRNVAKYLGTASGDGHPLRADDPDLDRLLSVQTPDAAPVVTAVTPASPARRPRDIDPDTVEETMTAVDFGLGAAAAKLGISRPALNDLIDAHPTLKRAKWLTDEEIAAGRVRAAGAGVPLWHVLRVSQRGLVRRIRDIDRGR